METLIQVLVFLAGVLTVVFTLFSAISTFVLPRAARSQLNRLVFGLTRRVFEFILHFVRSYDRRDAIMAYYAPISLMLLVPTWYILISLGFTGMYWSLGVGDWQTAFRLSGSSLFTLGFANADGLFIAILEFTEAMLGLILVALLIAYLPTMYSAFSRREQAVTMLEVRAGNPPTVLDMLLRFHRIQGLENLTETWKTWEAWFADVEESHTTLPALVFFRSPRGDSSWITSAGVVMDTAAFRLAALDIPFDPSAALCIRSGYLALRRIADYFEINYPRDPHYPANPISVTREEFDRVYDELTKDDVPLKADREQAWVDFAGWRVNYDRVLLVLCALVMAPIVPWSSDRMPRLNLPPLIIPRKKLRP
jgi:hypothetical protein